MKNLCFFAFVLVTCVTTAQIKLEGVVRDSLNNPLELANVVAINQETNSLESYGITNEQGKDYCARLRTSQAYTEADACFAVGITPIPHGTISILHHSDSSSPAFILVQ